mmetsp:Transcript_63111/g.150779  ORF Transcript_63111/g.150779 Transcript_63111/m.150779 type:complete len:224 (-) Transcript_63111:2635-3306(-)
MSSLSRGTPRVTFLAPTPAKWKVFRVICVAGSPTLCAASVPITSPGFTRDLMNFCFTSPSSQSKDCFESFSFSTIFRDARAQRRCALRITLALSSTSRPMVSPSAMARVTSNCDSRWSTFFTISMGVYLSSELVPSSSWMRFLARSSNLVMLMGKCCFASPSGKTSLQITLLVCFRFSYSASKICWSSVVALMWASTSGSSQPKPYSGSRYLCWKVFSSFRLS